MALTQLTKIDGGGISTTSDYRVGVITATKFIGPFEGSTGTFSGNITAVDGTFSGNVTVGGTLTYEDVTNIDSVGILTARAGIFIDDSITHIGDTNTKIRFPGNDTITAETGGSERLRITSTGKVGIGTDNPGKLLDVYKTSNDSRIRVRTTTAGAWFEADSASAGYHGIRLSSSGTEKWFVGSYATHNFQIKDGSASGGSSRITIVDGTGNIGIGTDAPDHNLHVFQNAGDSVVTIESQGNGNHSAIEFLRTTSGGDGKGGASIYVTGDTSATEARMHFGVGHNINHGQLPRMTIMGNGEVGIGTEDATEKLDVLGNIKVRQPAGTEAIIRINEATTNNAFNIKQTATQALIQTTASQPLNIRAQGGSSSTSYLAFWTRDDERLRITSDGKIGMGVDAPTFSVINSISANAARGIEIHKDGTDTGSAIKLAGDNGSGTKAWSQLGYSGANATAHWANYNTAGQKVGEIQIGNTGNIGIGDRTSSPDADLHVHTASGESTIHVQAATNANLNLRAHSGDSTVKFSDGSASNLGNINYDHGTDSLSFRVNSSTRLTIDSSGHITPNDAGAQDLGSTSKEFRNLYLGDQGKVYFGLDQDMTMEFDSSNANISLNAGSLSIINYANNEDVKILSDNGSGGVTNYIIADGGSGEVLLHHYGSQKFATSTTGITVTGEVAASQDYPNQRPSVDFNFVSVKKLDSRITYNRTGPASYTDEFGKVVLVGGNTPRFDHDPTTRECKGFLIEESRINILPYSTNVVGNSNWSRAGVLTENTTAVTAPDGSYDAIALRDNGSNGQHTLYEDVAISDITDVYTSSCWIKAGSKSFAEIFCNGTGSSGTVTIAYKFNLSTGAATYTGSGGFESGTSAIATEYPNGWWRCSVTCDVADSASGSGTFRWHVRPRDDSSGNYQGDNSIGIYVWGLQLEKGTFPTSYIPGSSTGGTATRGQGFAVIDGEELSDFYNPNASTVICQFDASNWVTYNPNKYERVWCFGNHNTETDTIEMFKQNSSNSQVRWRVRTSNTNVVGAANYTYSTTRPKLGFAWQLNDAGVSIDGGTVAGTGDSSISLPSITKLSLGNSGIENNNGGHGLTGWIRRFIYYPIKVSDAQLVTLTS